MEKTTDRVCLFSNDQRMSPMRNLRQTTEKIADHCSKIPRHVYEFLWLFKPNPENLETAGPREREKKALLPGSLKTRNPYPVVIFQDAWVFLHFSPFKSQAARYRALEVQNQTNCPKWPCKFSPTFKFCVSFENGLQPLLSLCRVFINAIVELWRPQGFPKDLSEIDYPLTSTNQRENALIPQIW